MMIAILAYLLFCVITTLIFWIEVYKLQRRIEHDLKKAMEEHTDA